MGNGGGVTQQLGEPGMELEQAHEHTKWPTESSIPVRCHHGRITKLCIGKFQRMNSNMNYEFSILIYQ